MSGHGGFRSRRTQPKAEERANRVLAVLAKAKAPLTPDDVYTAVMAHLKRQEVYESLLTLVRNGKAKRVVKARSSHEQPKFEAVEGGYAP